MVRGRGFGGLVKESGPKRWVCIFLKVKDGAYDYAILWAWLGQNLLGMFSLLVWESRKCRNPCFISRKFLGRFFMSMTGFN